MDAGEWARAEPMLKHHRQGKLPRNERYRNPLLMAVSFDLIDALKRCLRAQGMTYRDLAARVKLSEAAVKRMFSRRAMSASDHK